LLKSGLNRRLGDGAGDANERVFDQPLIALTPMRIPHFFARLLTAPADSAALALIAGVLAISFLTYEDYGMGWDDYAHWKYGELLLSYYGSGFTDLRAFSHYNLFYYGGGFDLAAAALGKLLPMDIFEIRRLLGALVGIAGLVIVWRTARLLAGSVAGLIALTLLSTTSLYYGHMFINPKDIPFAVAMAFLLYVCVRAFEEHPRPRPFTIALFGVALGLTVGTRVIGGVAILFAAIGAAVLLFTEIKELGARTAIARMATLAGRLAFALPLAYVVMALVWPWGALAPLNPFRALQYYSHFWEKPWQELFDGMLIAIPEMPRSYVPKLLLLKLPEGFLALAAAGLVGALVAVWRGNIEPWRRAALALLLATAVLPIAVVVATRPVLYNGVRHFLFVIPPLAIIAGLAGAYIFGALAVRTHLAAAAAAALLAVSIGFSVYDLARMHPYQYAQFNRVAGGLRGADDRYMIDYWGLGLKEAAETLRDRLEEGHVAPPRGRRWKVAVCGPAQTLLIELGPGFDVTNEAPGADFAISLGTFYCAELDAPVVAEVERDGVVLARAYDLRGRSYVTTWSYPPVTDKSAEAQGADRHP
jgi:dolichyl-phosphate-mannose-protein mannosyltransferase